MPRSGTLQAANSPSGLQVPVRIWFALVRHLSWWPIRPAPVLGCLTSRGSLDLSLCFSRARVQRLDAAHFSKASLGQPSIAALLSGGFKRLPHLALIQKPLCVGPPFSFLRSFPFLTFSFIFSHFSHALPVHSYIHGNPEPSTNPPSGPQPPQRLCRSLTLPSPCCAPVASTPCRTRPAMHGAVPLPRPHRALPSPSCVLLPYARPQPLKPRVASLAVTEDNWNQTYRTLDICAMPTCDDNADA